MFHLWFNTFFITEEEESDLQNGSSSQMSGNAGGSLTGASSLPSLPTTSSNCPQPDQHPITALAKATAGTPTYSQTPWVLQDTHQAQTQTERSHQFTASSHPHRSSAVFPSTQHHHVGNNSTANHVPSKTRTRKYKTLTLRKCDLDKANKDKQHKLFHENFRVSAFYWFIEWWVYNEPFWSHLCLCGSYALFASLSVCDNNLY